MDALDRDRLLALVEGDIALLLTVVATCLEDGERTLDAMRERLAAGDSDGVARHAEHVRTTMETLAADTAAAAARELEDRARADDLDGGAVALAAVTHEIGRIRTVFEDLARDAR